MTGRPSGRPSRGGQHGASGRRTSGFAYDGQASGNGASGGGAVAEALRRHPAGRYLLSGLVGLLFLGGAGMFAYPFVTDVYTERVVQGRLDNQFANLQAGGWSQTGEGEALTQITIPSLGVQTIVVEGTSAEALRAGAGHYPNTPLPGQSGNVGIAGHRTTYGKPFNQIEDLRTGDAIWLSTPVGDYRYEVVMPPDSFDNGQLLTVDGKQTPVYVTSPVDWEVIRSNPMDRPTLTLTSCHPKGSAAQRIIVRAVLTDEQPAGSYDGGGTTNAAGGIPSGLPGASEAVAAG